MRAKLLLCAALIAAFTFGLTAYAQDENAPIPSQTYVDESQMTRTETQTVGQAELGEKVPTVLEPGLAAIEANYAARLAGLREQAAAAATSEGRETLQMRMQEVKLEWSLALAYRQLELARERQDADAETEILQAIEHMTNPPVRELRQVERDPRVDEVPAGGAR